MEFCKVRNQSYHRLHLILDIPGLYLFLQVQLPLSLATIRHIHFAGFGWGEKIIQQLLAIIRWG